MHHEFSAPIGLAAEYAHPMEVMILAQGTISGPFLYCLFRNDLHIITVYIWVTLRLFQAVDAHSGYDFPWSLRHFLPFWAGADHHDFHHMAFVNCYSTSFRWWDFCLGTDSKYHAYKARVAAAKATEREAVNAKELEEIEKEGQRAEREVESYAKKGKKQ
jgi:methylsterol monooxygenase